MTKFKNRKVTFKDDGFKAGDKVMITGDTSYMGDFYNIGEVVTLEADWDGELAIVGQGSNGFDALGYLVEDETVEKEDSQMNNTIGFTISDRSVSLFLNGKMHVVPNTALNYRELREELEEFGFDADPDVLEDILDTKGSLTRLTEGKVTVENDEVLYDGEAIHNALASKLLRVLESGGNATVWAKFMNNVMANPSYRSREQLYEFLDRWDAPLTADGHFLAFKNVRSDFRDIHSGKFDNSPGQVVTMDRTKVDDNGNRTCSAGLHACATSYLSSFYVDGARTVCVKINPANVVSIPVDYNFAKMRVCRYEVLAEVDQDGIKRIEDTPVVEDDYDWTLEYDEYDEYGHLYDDYR